MKVRKFLIVSFIVLIVCALQYCTSVQKVRISQVQWAISSESKCRVTFSLSNLSDQPLTGTVVIRVFTGQGTVETRQELARSPIIAQNEWQVRISAKETLEYARDLDVLPNTRCDGVDVIPNLR